MSFALIDFCLFIFDIPCFVFSVSFIFFIGHYLWHKREPYSSPYFRVFFALSLIDAANYLWTLFTYRLGLWGLFVNFYHQQRFLPWFAYFMSGFWTYSQLFGHVLLSVNRAFAIMSPLNYETLFSNRLVASAIAFVFLLPLPFLIPRFWTDIIYTNENGPFRINLVNQHVGSICRVISAVLTFATGIFCALIESTSCLYYMRYQNRWIVKPGGRARQRLEVKICTYATTMLTIQICLATYQILLAFANYYKQNELMQVVQKHFVWLINLYSLSGPLFMFGSSASIRSNYTRFYRARLCPLVYKNWRSHIAFVSEQRCQALPRKFSPKDSFTFVGLERTKMVLLKTECKKTEVAQPVKVQLCFDSVLDVML